MDKTRHISATQVPQARGDHGIYPYSGVNHTAHAAKRPAPADFQESLKEAVQASRLDAISEIIAQQPAEWASINREALRDLLLLAAKRGCCDMAQLLIRASAPETLKALTLDDQLEMIEVVRCQLGSDDKMKKLLDALFKDAPDWQQRIDDLVDEAQGERKDLLASALCEYRAARMMVDATIYAASQLAIYDAAQRGDADRLQDSLDDALGIPRLERDSSGFAWLLNALERWMMGLITSSNAKALVNQPAGPTPLLHAAVSSGNAQTVRILLEKGANVSVTDKQGNTALSMAEKSGNRMLADLLREYGAAGIPAASPALPETLPCHSDMPVRDSGAGNPATFSRLLPDVAQALGQSGQMAKALNLGEDMCVAQMELLRAAYLADLSLLDISVIDDEEHGAARGADEVAAGLRRHHAAFVAEGESRLAAKQVDINRVLSNLASELSDELSYNREAFGQDLKNAGLCNLLVERALAAHDAAVEKPAWRDAGRRSEVFSTCLRSQLNHRTLAARGRASGRTQSGNAPHFDSLIQRQVALLGSYCTAAGSRQEAIAETTRYF